MDLLKVNIFFFNYFIMKKEKIYNKTKKNLTKNLLIFKKIYYLYYLKMINRKKFFISKKFIIRINCKLICC
ncbi:hypothetical protein V7Z36_01135 [Candidatus Carsonella ruddii]|uniref:Uncharacterized protein n=2 Tax=Carsonella ruddii TaxID=114186 RepID=A0AAE7KLM8_CARRU|nr:hypothetical protein [Candidatus Carsonella ruddii]QLK14162.1 hypothetical protein FK493_01090 [Candidatus Carsonella ruddii]